TCVGEGKRYYSNPWPGRLVYLRLGSRVRGDVLEATGTVATAAYGYAGRDNQCWGSWVGAESVLSVSQEGRNPLCPRRGGAGLLYRRSDGPIQEAIPAN